MERSSDKVPSSSSSSSTNSALHLKDTELRLGLPGSGSPDRKTGPGISLSQEEANGYSSLTHLNNFVSGPKRGFGDTISGGQVVGWPPIRSFRKNTMANKRLTKKYEYEHIVEGKSGGEWQQKLYVKVSMQGAPYQRKLDLSTITNYVQLSSALENMFSCFTIKSGKHGISEIGLMDLLHGSEYVLTYEDKDGDWMLVGDVPWGMFTNSCKRLRIMKGSDAIGLAPRVMGKSRNQN